MFCTLTTPIAYMSSYFSDCFAYSKGATYGYYAQKSGWILFSYGPDADEAGQMEKSGDPFWQERHGDIDSSLAVPQTVDGESVSGLSALYNCRMAQPSITLKTGCPHDIDPAASARLGAFTYDPSNGVKSEGDIYRVKQ